MNRVHFNNNIKGCFILVIATVIWGFAFVAQRFGMEHLGPLWFGAIRMYMGAGVLLPLIVIRRAIRKPSGKVTSGKRNR